MLSLVEDPRLETMEDLVEACHPVATREAHMSAGEVAEAITLAEEESAKMDRETGSSEEWFLLASRLGRYKVDHARTRIVR